MYFFLVTRICVTGFVGGRLVEVDINKINGKNELVKIYSSSIDCTIGKAERGKYCYEIVKFELC